MHLLKPLAALFFSLLFTALQKTGAQDLSKDSLTHPATTNSRWHFWGNSWHISSGYTFSRADDADLCIGRTYGVNHASGGISWVSLYSWGIGLGKITAYQGSEFLVKAYIEHQIVSAFPVMLGVRIDYMYDNQTNTSYLRPAAGLSFTYFDLLYNYSFNLSEGASEFRHGLTLRARCFIKKKDWKNIHEK